MKRPSQFMLLFLAVAGATFALGGEELTPTKPVYLGEPKDEAPRIVARGHADDSPRAVEFESSLRGPWTLEGNVFGERQDGQGLALRVGLELVPLGEGRHTSQALLSTVSSDDGTYRWVGLQPGNYRIRALPGRDDAEHLAIALDLELPETTRDEDKLQQDLVLPYPRTMLGSVQNRDERPQAGAKISISETGLHRGTAVVDATGRFKIDRVGPGPWEFLLRGSKGDTLPVENVTTNPVSTPTAVEVAIVTP